jgi:hypothetical protein
LSIPVLIGWLVPRKGFRGHTRYSGYWLWGEKRIFTPQSLTYRVALMPNFNSKNRFDRQNRQVDFIEGNLTVKEDCIMEQILENLNTTPIGQVLKRIASLPEVRKDKVLGVRRQLTDGKYDLSERLDIALDKVLEELTT